MKKIIASWVIIFPLFNTPLFSQNQTIVEPWPFYPLQRGDFWRYQISFLGGVYGYDRETIVDSLMIEGKWFWKKRFQGYTGGKDSTFLRQEDSTYIISRGLGQYSPISRDFKIDAVNGEKWLVQISSDDTTNKIWGKLDSTSQTEIFGKKRFRKHYRFWNEINGRLQWTKFITLAEGLGLIRIRGGDGGVDFQDVDLVGAIIDGKKYGEPVSVREKTPNAVVPKIFLINYPNPFTTTTMIEINLNGLISKEIVQLVAYNLTGQRVRTVYHDILPPTQRFRINWDGRDNFARNLPSGTYFIQLRAGNFIQTQRIIILR